MANDTETLADVSALCRDIARSYRNAPSNKIEIEGLKVCDFLDELANRIDAAAKREIPQPAGNAAAIRTALKRLRDASRDFYNQILNSQYSGILDKYTCTKQGFPAVLDVRAAIPAANVALAAAPAVDCPPSNVAALRDALLPFPSLCEWLVENAAKLGISDMVPKLRERCDKARAALGTTPADPPILCDAITFIAREMRERTDLDGRGMVDNFHIEYGEYGGFDALELIHAYGELLDECWKRIRDIFTNLAYSAHGVVVFHGPATERLRTLGFYVDRALLSLTASDPTLPPRKSRTDFIIIDDPHNDEVPTDKSIAPTESEATT